MADPAAVFYAVRVVMRPVYEPAQIVVLVHAPEMHSVAHADRNPFRKINVVRNQQALTTVYLDDKALVTRTFVVIG